MEEESAIVVPITVQKQLYGWEQMLLSPVALQKLYRYSTILYAISNSGLFFAKESAAPQFSFTVRCESSDYFFTP